jgi:hypothetical protein
MAAGDQQRRKQERDDYRAAGGGGINNANISGSRIPNASDRDAEQRILATAARRNAAVEAGHNPADYGYDENFNKTPAYTGRKLPPKPETAAKPLAPGAGVTAPGTGNRVPSLLQPNAGQIRGRINGNDAGAELKRMRAEAEARGEQPFSASKSERDYDAGLARTKEAADRDAAAAAAAAKPPPSAGAPAKPDAVATPIPLTGPPRSAMNPPGTPPAAPTAPSPGASPELSMRTPSGIATATLGALSAGNQMGSALLRKQAAKLGSIGAQWEALGKEAGGVLKNARTNIGITRGNYGNAVADSLIAEQRLKSAGQALKGTPRLTTGMADRFASAKKLADEATTGVARSKDAVKGFGRVAGTAQNYQRLAPTKALGLGKKATALLGKAADMTSKAGRFRRGNAYAEAALAALEVGRTSFDDKYGDESYQEMRDLAENNSKGAAFLKQTGRNMFNVGRGISQASMAITDGALDTRNANRELGIVKVQNQRSEQKADALKDLRRGMVPDAQYDAMTPEQKRGVMMAVAARRNAMRPARR